MPEEVTATSPRPVRRVVMSQRWRDLAMVHWSVPPRDVAAFMPPGTRPDTCGGRTYVGLIPFRMVDAGIGRGPAVPWLGTFLETNVRLYSVDARGRRGIVFRSLDADRLAVVLGARAAYGLPYIWSRLSFERAGPEPHRRDLLTYRTRRRREGAPSSDLTVRVGAPVLAPTPLEEWLTARWGLHSRWLGRTTYVPNEHGVWPLHRAEVVHLDDGLVAAAGFAGVTGRPPDSVLWSPGVEAVFGPPSGMLAR